MYSKTPNPIASETIEETAYHFDSTLNRLYGLNNYAGEILVLAQEINDRLYGNMRDDIDSDVLADNDSGGMLNRMNTEIGYLKETLQAIHTELEKLKLL